MVCNESLDIQPAVWCVMNHLGIKPAVWCVMDHLGIQPAVWCVMDHLGIQPAVWCVMNHYSNAEQILHRRISRQSQFVDSLLKSIS